jgi:DNA-directed RNA polymerase specialized sigma24 family protein
MTYPAQRFWWEPQQRRPTREEVDAAGIAWRKAAGLDDDDDDDWSFADEPAAPDPIAADVFGGISRRALAQARDNLAGATEQYEQAVRQARANGWTWAEIGRILGVSRQALHKRFRNRPTD